MMVIKKLMIVRIMEKDHKIRSVFDFAMSQNVTRMDTGLGRVGLSPNKACRKAQ
jgi:hypothetical protein